jgi:hypothetical protein
MGILAKSWYLKLKCFPSFSQKNWNLLLIFAVFNDSGEISFLLHQILDNRVVVGVTSALQSQFTLDGLAFGERFFFTALLAQALLSTAFNGAGFEGVICIFDLYLSGLVGTGDRGAPDGGDE